MLVRMAGGIDKSRYRNGAKASGMSRWLWCGGGFAAVAAIGLATAALLPVHGDDSAPSQAGLCPHYDVDPNNGKIRDRGFAACDGLAQNGRTDLIRKGFSDH